TDTWTRPSWTKFWQDTLRKRIDETTAHKQYPTEGSAFESQGIRKSRRLPSGSQSAWNDDSSRSRRGCEGVQAARPWRSGVPYGHEMGGNALGGRSPWYQVLHN